MRRYGRVETQRVAEEQRNRHNDILNILPVTEKDHERDEGVYMLRRLYSENASDSSVRKMVAALTG